MNLIFELIYLTLISTILILIEVGGDENPVTSSPSGVGVVNQKNNENLTDITLVVSQMQKMTNGLSNIEGFVKEIRNYTNATAHIVSGMRQDIDHLKKAVSSRPIYSSNVLTMPTPTTVPPLQISNRECGQTVTMRSSAEIFYQSLRQPNGSSDWQMETCVWVITTTSGGITNSYGGFNLKFTLIQLNSNNSTKNGTEAELSLHFRFRSRDGTSVRHLIKSDEIGQDIFVNDTVAVLVFRGKIGSNFKLKVSKSTVYTLPDSVTTERFSCSYYGGPFISIGETIKYPVSIYSYSSTNYGSTERRYMIFQARPTKKAKIKVLSVDTELTHDPLIIVKFSPEQNKFIMVATFSGPNGRLHFQTFYGQGGEPVLMYFHSDLSGTGAGFTISYSYVPQNEDENSLTAFTPTDGCGGLIPIMNQTDLTYERPKNGPQGLQTCIWVLWATGGGPVLYLLLSSNLNSSGVEPASLSRQSLIRWSLPNLLTNESQYSNPVEYSDQFSFLIFRSNEPGQKFSLRLKDKKANSYLSSYTGGVDILPLNDTDPNGTPSNLSYPVSGSYYEHLIRHFLFLKSFPGKVCHVSFDYIDTEAGSDTLTSYKFSNEENLQYYGKFSGRVGRLENHTLTSEVGQPLILFFSSDGSSNGAGYRISYSYKDASEMSSPHIDMKIDEDSPCGGVISTAEVSSISYKNSIDKNHSVTCIWIIKSTNYDVVIGLTLNKLLNFDDNSSAVLTMQDNLVVLGSPTPTKTLNSSHVGKELITASGVTTITFYSFHGNGQEGFHLSFRELGYGTRPLYYSNSYENPINYEVRTLNVTQSSQGEYSYTGSNAGAWTSVSTTSTPQFQFFILEPSAPQQQLQLTVTSINVQAYSILRIYKFSRENITTFKELRTLFNADGELYTDSFLANPNEPFLLTFKSDSMPTGGNGFTILFSSKDATSSNLTNSIGTGWMRRKMKCGGRIVLQTKLEMQYETPGNVTLDRNGQSSCMWLIVGEFALGLAYELQELNLTNSNSSLVLHFFISQNISSYVQLTSDKIGLDSSLTSWFGILVFKSTSIDGFTLRISVPGQNANSSTISSSSGKVGAKLYEAGTSFSTPISVKHPKLPVHYQPNERQFFVIKPLVGYQINLNVLSVDTEHVHDSLSLFRYSTIERKFNLIRSFTGTNYGATYFGEAEEPLVLFFYSDGSGQRFGFQFNYHYQVPLSLTTTTTTTPSAFRVGYGQGQQSLGIIGTRIPNPYINSTSNLNFSAQRRNSDEHLKLNEILTNFHKQMSQHSGSSERVILQIFGVFFLLMVMTATGIFGWVYWKRQMGRGPSTLIREQRESVTFSPTRGSTRILLAAEHEDN